MNATFHVISSIAIASVLNLKSTEKQVSAKALIKYGSGFICGILAHGFLDFLPHEYPLPSKLDVFIGIILFVLTFIFVQSQNRILVLVCFVGAIFPDVIDLAPAIANKYLGLPIPVLPNKIFPWHWKEFSGSIYDGSRRIESVTYHLLLLLICFGMIYANRQKFFKFWKVSMGQ